ncbi:tyrosine-type recombinase/integrase [Bordetella bronchiseptica]|uniref:Phage-related integrase n=1 Tax=Bordetella bronchiseptica (strain ATCC BAA-588 / NCTC 13252 / RB50) TaxID=257310 RepID=A0A0H3LRV4_BORBR|nr:integrase family protein [Bordetella bronchiseptica]KAK63027.1 site-specific recombinase, phage integrase family [Bordetella bronchiseptica 980-2]KCV30492.1 site-specific recombinase, phage integrase family [Bordetella bronchiseptica 00-P-2730]KDD50022.1 site-specific recombinase, phage integrase family [Bordetella bronchiseptica OSU553]KDD52740.1 site-specific recombinase, phage integrase family [Bordetella bronchiseptica RB630]KCV51903.1 site-specific recombinase, phage integrase family [
MPTVKKLTKQVVDGLPTPATGQAFHWCSVTPGFAVRVTASGAKSYIVQGRVNSKTCRYTIGPCELLGTDEARKRALARLLEMHDGMNPQVERKRRQAQGVTLREVMEDYVENKRTKHGTLRDSSQADIKRCVTQHLADWADKPVASITREACVKRFRELSATAPTTANQVFRNLRALCNWARETNVAPDGSYPILPINPVVQAFKSVTWNKEVTREEFVPLAKVGAVWNMLAERSNAQIYTTADVTAAHLVMFLILTGARIGEGSALHWKDVRLDDEVPSFTFTQTKNHNEVTIPLSTQLHALLAARYSARRPDEEYVFPSRTGTREPHMQDARGTMQRVSKIAGLHLHNHDLRRTFLAIAIECGVEMWKAEILTNHLPQTVTLKHYTQTRDLRYLQADTQRVADWITKQAQVASGQNVVALRA